MADITSDSLTNEQRDKLRQFQEVTNLDDRDMAVVTLESLDWNVEQAIEAHLSDSFQPVSTSSAHMSDSFQPSVSSAPPPHLDELPSLVAHPLMAPFSYPPSASHSSVSHSPVALDGDSDDEYPMTSEPSFKANDDTVPLVPTDCDSIGEALQNFRSVFEARYSHDCPFLPSFFVGSLASAAREAFENPDVRQRRPLAIYLHDDRSIARHIFPKQVLCNEQVANLLRAQFVLWPWDVTQKENEMKLVSFLNESGFGTARMEWMSLVGPGYEQLPVLITLVKEGATIHCQQLIKGSDSPDVAMEKLLQTVDMHGQQKVMAEKVEQERVERERIRQEQASEYEKSLAADRARLEQQKQEQKAQKDAIEQSRKEFEEEENRRNQLASSLPEEPPEGNNAFSVKFRLPDGGQLMRRFNRSDYLNVLLTFLESQGYSRDKFRFFNSDFPKKDVSEMAGDKSLADLKWPVREQIHVEER